VRESEVIKTIEAETKTVLDEKGEYKDKVFTGTSSSVLQCRLAE